MTNRILGKGKFRLLWGIILAIVLLGSFMVSLAGASEIYAQGSTYDLAVTRTLPATLSPGQTFNVTVSFTAPADNFNSVRLNDCVPSGWIITANDDLNTPNSDANNVSGNEIDYVWNGPISNGTIFTAIYQVTVPLNATPGIYSFTNYPPAAQLEYYVGSAGPYFNNIAGQDSVTLGAGVIQGTTYAANGAILGGVIISMDGTIMTASTADGTFQLIPAATGLHTILASDAGYGIQSQTVDMTDINATYSLDFKGNNSLVPNTSDVSYVLACINKWKYQPANGTGLDISKVLSIINAWKYPPTNVGGPIQYGQEVTGTIGQSDGYQDWTFTGQAGNIVTIQMVQNGGASLYPYEVIYDPSGTAVTAGGNDEIPGALIGNYKLAFSGTYTIQARGDPNGFSTTGGYILSLSLKPPTESITYGEEVSGQINFDGDYQSWTFTGQAGNIVTIQMVQNGGASLYPYEVIYDPSGTAVTAGGNDEIPGALIGNYKLAFSGTYTIQARGDPNGFSTTGGYILSLSLKPPTEYITYGEEVSGQINFDGDYQSWTFTGQAGNIVTIQMVQNGGASLYPYEVIYDPSGTAVTTGGNDEIPGALIGNYRLAFSGTYTIQARGDPNGFSTTGGYILSLNKN